MKTTHQLKALWLAASTGLLALAGSINAQIITYQGVLSDQGEPAEGIYDLKFQFRQPGPPPVLFDPPIVLPAVLVSGGRFTVPLDTTGVPVQDPSPLELVVCVRRTGEPDFVPLDPPQSVTPAPRALAADVAGSVPVGGLPPSVVQNDVAPFFGVPLTAPQLILPDPNSILRFGPFGDCTIGVDPELPGLTETDPTGFRLLGQDNQGCRLIFGPTMDCTVEVDPTGPAGLLLRDPNGVRILNPDPTGATGPTLRFGPTDDCTIGIDPNLPGLTERDPTGFRLLGQNGQGCRLIFGPTMDCTVEVDPTGPGGLLLRDPSGVRILNPDPSGETGPTLRFGPTDDCTIQVDPSGPGGLLLSDPSGVRILNPDPSGETGPTLRFGPTDDCTIGVDPNLPGLTERDPTGFRLLGQNSQGCRLIFGPTMDCTVEVDPTGPAGLLLRDPSGVRILNPDPTGATGPTLRFGPTDDCTIGIDPNLPGLTERDPTGFRLLGQNGQGCRLIFGPTMDCTVEVDPTGPAGLLLRDPSGVRILNPDPTGNPVLRFGPTDDCIVQADPEQGLLLRDPNGIRIPFSPGPAGQLLPAVLSLGDAGECRYRVNPPGAGPRGMILEDPEGLLLVNPQGGAGALSFGESGECRLRVGELPNGKQGLMIEDPNGIQVLAVDSFFDIVHANEFIQTSTRRLKDNIQRIEEPLDKIKQLEGVTFDWKAERGGKPAIGFIAEEVGKVFPEVVAFEEDGVNATGMNYGHLVAVTVEGIKAQQDQIEDLEKENNELKESVADMQAQMAALSAQIRALSAQ